MSSCHSVNLRFICILNMVWGSGALTKVNMLEWGRLKKGNKAAQRSCGNSTVGDTQMSTGSNIEGGLALSRGLDPKTCKGPCNFNYSVMKGKE